MPLTLDPSSPAYKKAKRLHFKTTKHRDPNTDLDWTPFRAAEKKYKARFPPPDLSNVLDLAILDATREHEIQQGRWRGRLNTIEYREITRVDQHTRSYIIPSVPGLVILPSFVPPKKQRELVKWSISDQARQPNETNLDIHYLLPEDGIWNAWLSVRNDPNKDVFIQPRVTDKFSTNKEPPGPRRLVNNMPAMPDNFTAIVSIPKPPQTPSTNIRPIFLSSLLRKLRWANIGWHYHWGTKQYDFTKGQGTVDPRIRELCKNAVNAVNWQQVYGNSETDWSETEPDWRSWDETYEPDAGIVNFYQIKDTLMAHVDRSELCTTSPLVSISLGNAAVFLIGGLTRDSDPIPILLRSGDAIIMSGPNCRRAYHGIPRILEGTLPPHLESEDDTDWKPYREYMSTTRININVRQVFPRGFNPSL